MNVLAGAPVRVVLPVLLLVAQLHDELIKAICKIRCGRRRQCCASTRKGRGVRIAAASAGADRKPPATIKKADTIETRRSDLPRFLKPPRNFMPLSPAELSRDRGETAVSETSPCRSRNRQGFRLGKYLLAWMFPRRRGGMASSCGNFMFADCDGCVPNQATQQFPTIK